MPAEWEPHEATWIAWPHNRSDWPGKFEAIPWVYAEIVRHLARGRARQHPGRTTRRRKRRLARCWFARTFCRKKPPTRASLPGNVAFHPHSHQSRLDARLRARSFVRRDSRKATELPCCRGHRLALQCLGQVQRLEARRAGLGGDRQAPATCRRGSRTSTSTASRIGWCWRAAASTSTAAAR